MEQEQLRLENFETSPELSEVKVIYKTKNKPKVKIVNSKEAFAVLISLYDKDIIEYQEQFFLLLLNKANFVLGWIKLSTGGTSGTVVDAKVIFTLALKTNASSIILCHNHPSGNIRPSDRDVTLTKTIVSCSQFMDIKLLDHLIVSNDDHYFSFADDGLI